MIITYYDRFTEKFTKMRCYEISFGSESIFARDLDSHEHQIRVQDVCMVTEDNDNDR